MVPGWRRPAELRVQGAGPFLGAEGPLPPTPRVSPTVPPRAPLSPTLKLNNVFFQAEFVSIIELPATYLKSLDRPLEEQRIARSKSFELFLSPQITEQQAIVVCLNLVTRSVLPSYFHLQSGQDLRAICDGIDPGFKQNAKNKYTQINNGRGKTTRGSGLRNASVNPGRALTT